MKVNKKTTILSMMATISFFVVYFINKEKMNFILGCTWLCITIEEYRKMRKEI